MTEKNNGFLRFLLTKNHTGLVYIIGLIVSWLYFLIYSVIQGGGYARILFFGNGEDALMDFYNSCRDAAQGIGVYAERHVIYPPLANLYYRFCGAFISDDYLDTNFEQRLQFSSTLSNLMIFIVSAIIAAAILVVLVYCYTDGSKIHRTAIAISSVISFPYIFLLERGNCLTIVVVLLCFFVFCYNSDNKAISELACVALALAAGFKLYPAVMGLVLIIDKRWKQAIRTTIYGLIAIFAPFVFYGGCYGVKLWINNLIHFSDSKASVVTFTGTTDVTGAFKAMGIQISFIVPAVICIIAAFVLKKNHRKHIALFVTMLTIPGSGGVYSYIFLIIPLLMMFNEEIINIYDYLYLAVIMAMFMPYVLPLHFENGYLSINYAVSGLVVLALFLLITLDLIYSLFKRFRSKSIIAVIPLVFCFFAPSRSVSADSTVIANHTLAPKLQGVSSETVVVISFAIVFISVAVVTLGVLAVQYARSNKKKYRGDAHADSNSRQHN